MTSQPRELGIPSWTFGDRTRKIRRARNLTQAEFARTLGVGEKASAAWEVSDRMPRDVVSIAKRIELAFGVPASWVLGLDDGTPTPPGSPGGESAGSRSFGDTPGFARPVRIAA